VRKNILYASRLEGDLSLGVEPTRVRGTVKDWARMDFPGGRIAGQSEQESYEESVTQKYDIGTRRVQDERTFHYCKASANGCERAYWGAQNYNHYLSDGTADCFEGNSTGNQIIGSVTLVIPDTNTAHTLDFFAGGWVVLFHAIQTQMARIRSSTASDGATVTLTLWDPLAIATTATFCTVHPSIYSKVERVHGAGDSKAATVCVPIIPITASYYFWGLTYGPCFAVATPAYPGTNAYERTVSWNYDGSISLTPAFGAASYRQIAGYLLPRISADGDQFFMLTIAP